MVQYEDPEYDLVDDVFSEMSNLTLKLKKMIDNIISCHNKSSKIIQINKSATPESTNTVSLNICHISRSYLNPSHKLVR